MPVDVDRNAWDRRPGETTRAHRAFVAFRDAGRARQVRRLVADGVLPSNARHWSTRWNWHGRAAAWDDACQRAADEDRLDQLRKMPVNHARIGRALQAAALGALQRLDTGTVSPGDVARLLDLGCRIERDALLLDVRSAAVRDDAWATIVAELERI